MTTETRAQMIRDLLDNKISNENQLIQRYAETAYKQFATEIEQQTEDPVAIARRAAEATVEALKMAWDQTKDEPFSGNLIIIGGLNITINYNQPVTTEMPKQPEKKTRKVRARKVRTIKLRAIYDTDLCLRDRVIFSYLWSVAYCRRQKRQKWRTVSANRLKQKLGYRKVLIAESICLLTSKGMLDGHGCPQRHKAVNKKQFWRITFSSEKDIVCQVTQLQIKDSKSVSWQWAETALGVSRRNYFRAKKGWSPLALKRSPLAL